MTAKLSQILFVATLSLLLGGWSSVQNPSTQEALYPQPYAFAPGETATVSPAFKPDLPTDYTMHDYLVYLLNDVQAFWSPLMVRDGYPEPAVTYSFPAPGEAVLTECVLPAPHNSLQAFYCGPDDQIVITQEMAWQLWNGTIKTNLEPPVEYAAGDFSVAFVVAHEYGHNLQAELRWNGVSINVVPKTASRGIELNADCLGGVWANSVYARGLLESTDIQEVMRTLADLGQDTAILNPTHGTPKERTDAFLLGYESGTPASCKKYMAAPY